MSREPHVPSATSSRLEAAACNACGHLFLPLGPVCPRCWSGNVGTRPLSGLGEVATFTVYRQRYRADFPPPYVVALIALREGPRMISNIIDCPPESVRVGMAVRVRHEARGGRLLPLFAPAADAAEATTAHNGGPT